MKVSVIIPAYNSEKFIGRSIRSILNQNLPQHEYEIIIINDNSNDRTPYAIEMFSDQVNVLTNTENQGLASSLNRGINASKGEFIIRLDSDDYVNSNYLSILSYFLEVNPEYEAVKCDYYKVNDEEIILQRCNSVEQPIGCGIMFRRDVLFELELYDQDLRMNEEVDLSIRFDERNYKMGHIKLPLYRYRQHDQNMTKNANMKKHFDSLVKQKQRKREI